MAATSEYWVGATIGEGSYGKVVHARHKATEKNVAIKVVTKLSIRKDPRRKNEILKEKMLLTTLNSNYVVSLWASFHDEECVYLVMECMEGGDLEQAIRHGRSKMLTQIVKPILAKSICTNCIGDEWTRVVIPHFANQLISAIEFIHSRQVIHCDLKPQNIVLTSGGDLKLTDFGSAIFLTDAGKCFSSVDSNRNHGSIMGTAEYASPEVIRGTISPSFGIDLWSLGCIFYTMWEGVSPFQDATYALVIQRIMNHVSKAENHDLNSLFMTERWETMVNELLVLEPSRRLGMNDLSIENQGKIIYSSIREKLSIESKSEAEVKEILLATMTLPAWSIDADIATYRDGAKGWSTFLL
jgi:3-phosphoinositide dependent protein kinase-1